LINKPVRICKYACKKIKVLQLGSSSGLYGAERWILSLIKYLDATKIESHVGSIRDQTDIEVPLCIEASKLGFPAHIIDSNEKFGLAAVRNLKNQIDEQQIDILHSHGYKTDIVGRLATIGTPCKNLSTPHGWTQQPGLKLWLYELLDRAVFPFFDVVAPLSEGILKPLCRIPGLKSKLHFIRNGVDIDEIDNQNEISDEIRSLIKKRAFVIGYIGRLTAGKGLDILLNTFAEYAEPHWEIAIIGEGDQSTELKTIVEKLKILNRVHFYGFRPDRLSFLKGFDVFVLPSRSEGIPRCLMEAMSAEIPVVASDIPGCRYLIDGKTTGLLFEMDNKKDLAKSIKVLDSDQEIRKKIMKVGKKFIQTNYSVDRMAKQYEELYFRMLRS